MIERRKEERKERRQRNQTKKIAMMTINIRRKKRIREIRR